MGGGRGNGVRIGLPVLTRSDNMYRVQAEVDGVPVWFESADVPLAPRAEAFASGFLAPALAAGRPLRVEAPLDPTWRQNVARILPFWRKWWGWHVGDPIRGGGEHDGGSNRPPRDNAQPSDDAPRYTVSCFSGGVDSSYTVLRSRTHAAAIDRLLCVHGFDIKIDDGARMAAWEPRLRAIAAAVGKPAIVLRTNLRAHPLYARGWERTHGGAIAAVGHVLAGAGRLVVPATLTTDKTYGWGSHHQTDAFWSSGALEVVHADADVNRRQKVRALADEPLVYDALRVCWEGKTAAGNCSACEKCVRTMVLLHHFGRLEQFTAFDRSVPLTHRLKALRRIPPHLWYVYQGLLDDGLGGEVGEAVRRLLPDKTPPSVARRVARKAKRKLVGLFGER
jgi:hypothetical protein